MKSKPFHRIVVAFVSIISLLGVQIVQSAPTNLTLESDFEKERQSAGLDLLVPVANFHSTFLFLNPRASADSQEQSVGSLGIGMRTLLPARDIIVGLNAYYDGADSHYNNRFHGFGIGGELLLTDWVSVRGNYYFADSAQPIVDTKRDVSIDRARSVSRSGFVSYGDPYGQSHSIMQKRFTGYRETTIETTTRTERVYEKREASLGGYDVELGLRLPKVPETRVYATYESRDNPFGGTIEGYGARAEIHLLPGLILDGGYVENETFTEGNWSVGMRASVKLGGQDGGIRRAFNRSFAPRQRSFSERLTDSVVRNPFRTTDHVAENVAKRQVERTVDRQSTTKIQKVDVLTVRDDIIWVDNTYEGAEEGTYEQPFATVQGGGDQALTNYQNSQNIWTVIVQGKGMNYQEQASFNGGSVHFLDGSIPIKAFGQKSFQASSQQAWVQGSMSFANMGAVAVEGLGLINAEGVDTGLSFDDSQMVALIDNDIRGYNFSGASMRNVEEGRVVGNRFSDSSHGLIIGSLNGLSQVLVQGNDFDSNKSRHLYAMTLDQGEIDLEVLGNTFRNGMSQIEITSGNATKVRVNVAGNTFQSVGNYGLTLSAENDSDATLYFHGNRMEGSYDEALLDIRATGSSDAIAWIFENDFNASAMQQIFLGSGVDVDPSAATIAATITDNHFNAANSSAAISLWSRQQGSLNATIMGNDFSGKYGMGVESVNFESGHQYLFITENTFRGEFLQSGLTLSNKSDAQNNEAIIGLNHFTNSPVGIDMDNQASEDWVLHIEGNLFQEITGSGVQYVGALASQATFNILNNQFLSAGEKGIDLELKDNAFLNFTISSNAVDGASVAGIQLRTWDNSSSFGIMANNMVSNSKENGIRILAQSTATSDILILGNTIEGNVTGILATDNGWTTGLNLQVVDNFFQGNENGLRIEINNPNSTAKAFLLSNEFVEGSLGIYLSGAGLHMSGEENVMVDINQWLQLGVNPSGDLKVNDVLYQF